MSEFEAGTALRHVLELNGYLSVGSRRAEGVDIYERQRKAIDLVVLDMSMPRVSGDEAPKQLRAPTSSLK